MHPSLTSKYFTSESLDNSDLRQAVSDKPTLRIPDILRKRDQSAGYSIPDE